MTLSTNFTATLDRAIEKEIGKGTVAHTMVTNKGNRTNPYTVVIHTNSLQDKLEDKVATAIKKALKLDAYSIMFNSPRKIGDSITYLGQFMLNKPKVTEDVDLPLLRALIEGEVSPTASMQVPGLKISIGDADNSSWRNKVSKALTDLGYGVEAQGPSDGSTSYSFLIALPKGKKREQVIDQLRKKLNFDGWMTAAYYDLAEE